MISKDNNGRPVGQLLKPPAEAIDKLRSDALRLRVDNVSTHNDHVRLKLVQLLEEVLENFGVLIMTLKSTPVDVGQVCDLDQRMLPLLIILERLIIP